jgi:solute carrier family 25 uncoupling protein 8/9
MAAPTAAQAWGRRHPTAAHFAASAAAVGGATFATNGIDVVKVRQQLAAGAAPRHLLAVGAALVRAEGPAALLAGAGPAVARGVAYGGLRIGLYAPLRDALAPPGAEPGLFAKIGAGSVAGAGAAALANPTDLVKTRMQAAGAGRAGAMAVAAAVAREGGARALWRGTTPSAARAGLLTAAQCATYDEAKAAVVARAGWAPEALRTHFAASALAGLVTTTVTAPVDMVKTRMFAAAAGGAGAGGAAAAAEGPLAVAAGIVRREGAAALFRGWGANWARQGPMTTLIMLGNEALRPRLGLAGV